MPQTLEPCKILQSYFTQQGMLWLPFCPIAYSSSPCRLKLGNPYKISIIFFIFTWWAGTTSWTIRISNLSRGKRGTFLKWSRLAPGPPSLLYNKHQKLYLEGKAAESWSYNFSPHLCLYAVRKDNFTAYNFPTCCSYKCVHNLESFPLEEFCKAGPVLSINVPCTNKAASTGNKEGLDFAKILSFQTKPKYPCCTEAAEYN